MDVQETLNRHERSIGRIEGKLDSLATKDFVRQEVHQAIKAIDAKIDKQTDDLAQQIKDLSDKVERERSWRMKITGGASVLALIVVAISTLVTTLASVGIIPV